MSYIINKTNGDTLIVLQDGTFDNTISNSGGQGLNLVGKNYISYGELQQENFVKLLENFANSSQPTGALTGQLWYDTSKSTLKYFDGTKFRPVTRTTIGSVLPSSIDSTPSLLGDFWWDTNEEQLKVYNGTGWTLIGPSSKKGEGLNSSIVEAGYTSAGEKRMMIKLYADSVLAGIISSSSEYTPNVAIPGFTTIKPGINLSSAINGNKLHGTATNSDKLGNVLPSDYLRSDIDGTFNGTLSVTNSLNIGDSKLTLLADSSSLLIHNHTSDKNLVLSSNVGGSQVNSLVIDSTTGLVSVSSDPNSNLGVATKQYVDSMISAGVGTITGNIIPATNNLYTIGNTSLRLSAIYATTLSGTAIEAKYADLAERFEADDVYQPGTVVELGGMAEITKAGEDLSERVFGVISSKAAYLMNSGAGTDETHPPVAVSGRVPVRVVGRVKKGDRLVSAGNGLARAGKHRELTPWNVIGRALTDKNSENEGIIEAIVKLNS